MAKLFADENFPRPVVEELRRLGHDVLTMPEAGRSGRALPDNEVLGAASADSRAVLTLNRRHFIRLHIQNPNHTGIVVCTFDPDFDGQATRIHSALAQEAGLVGRLVRVNRPRK